MKKATIGTNVRARPRHTRTAKGSICSGGRRNRGLGCTGRCKSRIFQEKATRRRVYANMFGRGGEGRDMRNEIRTRRKGSVAEDQIVNSFDSAYKDKRVPLRLDVATSVCRGGSIK